MTSRKSPRRHRIDATISALAVLAGSSLIAVLAFGIILGSVANSPHPHSTSTSAVKSLSPSASPTPTSIAPTVLAIGDSVMKGYGVPAGGSWLRLIAHKHGWNLIDRSCDGAGFIHVAPADCKETIPEIITDAKDVTPDFVIVSGSANDFGTNNAQLQVVTDNAIHQLRAEFPHATIIGLNVAWGDQQPPGKVAIINAQIAAAMGSVSGIYVDFGAPLRSHPELMQADHLHPLATGQIVLEAAIEQSLARTGLVI